MTILEIEFISLIGHSLVIMDAPPAYEKHDSSQYNPNQLDNTKFEVIPPLAGVHSSGLYFAPGLMAILGQATINLYREKDNAIRFRICNSQGFLLGYIIDEFTKYKAYRRGHKLLLVTVTDEVLLRFTLAETTTIELPSGNGILHLLVVPIHHFIR